MAEKNTTMGDDPLAWLADGDEAPATKTKKTPAKRTRVRRSTASKAKKAKPKTETELLEESFAALAPQGEALAARFYERLFVKYPEVVPLFEDISITGQQKKLLASLVLLVQNLHNPEVLTEYLQGLGARHVQYGVTEDDYPKVAENLLAVMEEFAGDLWTPDVQAAWENTLGTVATIMLEAYEPAEADDMTTTQKQATEQAEELARMSSAVNGSATAVMMINRDFEITFVNEATITMLQPYEDTLAEIFPGFDLDNLLGKNIDNFHKNPAKQRKLLANPKNLPYQTDIQVGPLSFRLNVSAMMDGKNYIGNALEWANVTEAKAKELEVSRLQAAVDGSSTALMMCDENRVITYCNRAVVELLTNRLTELRKVFPGLDLSKVVGTCIDDFHKDPSHQARILSDVNNLPYNTQIELVGLHFDLTATAILDPDGNFMGNTVEWRDITEQTKGEIEIQNLIKSAQAGQLQERIDATSYQGFMQSVAQGMNELLEAVLAPVSETINIAQALSNGDLTQNVDGEYQGMFEALAKALNESINQLSGTVTEISETAVSIGTGATEITRGNVDLSQRTEEQASSLEETASSMEELTSTVRQNSDNAAQANQLAASAREQAEKGGSVIKEAIEAMSAISTSSKKVTDIIGVIDEIAFQTNLLALNAAVEAARAGEQGRGFAVVASEVRNLAQRSAGAAKEIKELINDSGEKVKEGSMLVDESGRTLEDIVAGAKKVGDIISEIAAAGAEQTSGIGQVNTAVSQMDEMTQQNAALVEQAAAASESLDEQGKNLQRLMAFFDTGVETVKLDEQAEVEEAEKPEPKPAPKKTTAKKTTRKPAAKKTAAKKTAAPATADDEWDEF